MPPPTLSKDWTQEKHKDHASFYTLQGLDTGKAQKPCLLLHSPRTGHRKSTKIMPPCTLSKDWTQEKHKDHASSYTLQGLDTGKAQRPCLLVHSPRTGHRKSTKTMPPPTLSKDWTQEKHKDHASLYTLQGLDTGKAQRPCLLVHSPRTGHRKSTGPVSKCKGIMNVPQQQATLI
ncbi:hypothetical protein EOD39_11713 [Acipenser ruthenus]|uniref:Uncharacterized protein n=1 Tax=Acipenser ruthenus TaxID=7906 RepID=A0A444UMX2_ACIRT|nr:hypothetical protein EOD39_11713 [Acipenser ruthenus]